MKIYYSLIICLLIFSSCTEHYESEDEEQIVSTTDSFATHYFNYNLKEAMPFCTPESEKWIRYTASNIFQEDIDLLKQQKEGATHETDDIIYINDTSAMVKCHVYNVMKIDTIGKPGTISEHEIYNISLVKRDRKWLVKMEGPLQNEKQSRD